MPVSIKKIISTIESMPDVFTRKALTDIIVRPEDEKPVKNNTGKKKSVYRPQKDISKIEETLTALAALGYLEKGKKVFRKQGSLEFEGGIKLNSSKDAIAEYNGKDIIISRIDSNSAQNEDHVRIKIYDYKKGFFYGKVTGISRRKKTLHAAKVERKSGGSAILSLLDTPADMEVICQKPVKEINAGDFAIISLTGKTISGRRDCRIMQTFDRENEEFDFLRIKLKHTLPDAYTGKLEEISPEELIPEDELKNRKDYTKLFTVTIDGETAKDFDDAISIKAGRNSTKLYVHIADVSAYVAIGSELDQEAFKRGTSYYLGSKVIPMLPEVISNESCSLKETQKRFTLTAEIIFDSSGNMTKFEAYRGIIKVNKRLTYEKADEILGKRGFGSLNANLKQMYLLSKTLNKKRSSQGRLDLNLTDQEIIYDGDKLKEIRFAKRLRSHMLIEELMLSANEAVSRFIKEKEIPSLYRVHEKISDDNNESLKKFMKVLGIKVPLKKGAALNLQEVLHKVAGEPYEQVVSLVILKSMMQAFYGPEPLGHFGLGFTDYTHFTSPIRRYPDLVVHRCLKSVIDSSPPPYTMPELLEIGEKSSIMERIAQKGERDLIKIKSCRILKDSVGMEFEAVISGMTKFGLFISLIDMPIEGMIPLKNMRDDYYILNEEEYTVTGKRSNKVFRLGDKLKVKLVKAEIETLRIDFEPARTPRRK